MEVLEEYAYNESVLKNGFSGLNTTDGGRRNQYNYYAMLLTLLIFVIVFGNVLVCMAVSREKALQTTTNYLIVSLAVADLLVATLVMPWVVYLEVGYEIQMITHYSNFLKQIVLKSDWLIRIHLCPHHSS